MEKEERILTEKIGLRSLILEHFTFDCMLELYKLLKDPSITNNTKRDELVGILDKYHISHERVGTGTNRYTAIIDGFIMKFCLDTDGMIDNLREFKYTTFLQPDVIRVYESLLDGLIMVCEYVEVMDLKSFYNSKVQDDWLKICKRISSQYFIGDIGVDNKNYTNLGFRKNLTHDLVVLDFAYCYPLSYKAFTCSCSSTRPILYYNEKYTHLICPKCKKSYSFADIRRKMSRTEQEKEIGNVREMGYLITSPHQMVPVDPRFSILPDQEKKKKKQLFSKKIWKEGIDHSEKEYHFGESPEEKEEPIDDDEMWEDLKYEDY